MSITQTKFKSLQQKTKTKRAKLRTEKSRLKKHLAELTSKQAALKSAMANGARVTSASVKSIQSQINKLQENIVKARDTIESFELEITETLDALIFSADPRDQIEMLDDSIPIFLAPIRVETRFITVKHIARVDREKLPSDFSSDPGGIFDDGINDFNEISIGTVFKQVQKLPVIEDTEELWIRIFPDDLAVHTHEEELTEIEKKAAQTYWRYIWRAADNDGLRIGAWRGIVAGRGPERAAWIARQMTPTNPDDQPKSVVSDEDDLPVEPVFPSLDDRENTWSEAPHSRIMPERFVVRLYKGDAFREVVGNNIPEPLHLGINPHAEGDELESENGSIQLKDKIKWLQEFDEAEKIGMAIRVPLELEEEKKFTKILVLGIKASADQDEGQALMEGLIDNHHYTAGGFSVIPQGTATNNTEDKESGYTALNSNEEDLFDIEMGNALFTPTHVDKNKTDGQHLADALGIEYSAVQNIKYADQTDIKDAMCMNQALWPVTFGYYLPQMMHPVFSESDIIRTKEHFGKYVLGRGRVPAIRIDNQPYGILPTTAFKKWKYNTNSAHHKYLRGLQNEILKNLEVTWNNLVKKVKTANSKANQGNVEKLFVDVLGLHASSVEYYQRYVTGPYLLWNMHNYSRVITSSISQPENISYAKSLDFFELFGDQDFAFSFPPRLFDFFYSRDHKFLDGPVIDPIGIHENKFLTALGTDDENYIDWLLKSNWHQIKHENFSTIGNANVKAPNSLLYLMLRHATLLEYTRTGFTILAELGIASQVAYYDTEFTNITGINFDNIELREMVKAGVLFKEGMKVEKKIDKEIDKEFTRREEAGELTGMNINEIRAARSELKDAKLSDTRAELLEKAELEVESVLGTQFAKVSKTELLFEPQVGLNGISVASLIWDDLQKPKSQSQYEIMHDLKNNLECLKGLSTAKLERCFAEHIDLANYRLDSWFYSLVLERLQALRGSGSTRKKGLYIGAYAWLENLYKGSYKAVHYREVDIKKERVLIPEVAEVSFGANVDLDIAISGIKSFEFDQGKLNLNLPSAVLSHPDAAIGFASARSTASASSIQKNLIATGAKTLFIDQSTTKLKVANPAFISSVAVDKIVPPFAYLGNASDGAGQITYDITSDRYINKPREDSENQGFIHAPSINHATTAAVLRAGYETHRLNNGSNEDALAININSERVRKALFYLEGVNNGQELGALLGYQLERGLHDHSEELDEFIYDMRLKYPFVSGRVTDSSGVTSIDKAEAYNVINGMELLENSEDPEDDYPYGISNMPVDAARKNAIIGEVRKMHDAIDGINDLLMAESMHQVVLGNYPKASAILRALGGDPLAINPDIIKTPRTFDVLNHRVGCHFDLSANGHKIWTTTGTPRSIAAPHLNRWIANLVPDPDKIIIHYQYHNLDAEGQPSNSTSDTLKMRDLGIEAIDLIFLNGFNKSEGGTTDLLNLLNYHVRKNEANADDVEVQISLADRSGFSSDEYSYFEIQALLDQLGTLVGESRALRPSDFLLSSSHDEQVSANPGLGYNLTNLTNRMQDVIELTMSNGERGFAGVLVDLESGIASAETVTEDVATHVTGVLDGLRNALHGAATLGIQNAEPPTVVDITFEISQKLLETAYPALEEMKAKKVEIDRYISDLSSVSDDEMKIKVLEGLGKATFGRSFKVYPEYELYNQGQIQSAMDYADYLDFAGDDAVDHWLHGISPVRKRMRNLNQVGLLANALGTDNGVLDFSVAQIPLEPLDNALAPQTRWLGVQFPEDYDIPDENLSMLFFDPAGYSASGLQAGMMIDEWVEEMPHDRVQTGMSVHYNNPNSEPPQTCLLAVSPNLDGKWSWDDLMDTLVETLDWAKKRAVDPDILNNSIYPQVLPAIYAAVSASDDTPTLDFGRNVVPEPIKGIFGMIKVQDYGIRMVDFDDFLIDDL
ncbi:MAG: hypothetical protein AAGA77_02850 [Bacteroidota bacterium]